MSAQPLTQRALNRATLARQLLLERSTMPVPAAVEHLVGLQAQTPHTWYVGLWARLADLDAASVGAMLVDRGLVRIALMRSTIHLVTAPDALRLREVMQPVLVRSFSGQFGKHLVGVDQEELAAAGRRILEEQPMMFSQLGRALAEHFPGRDEASLAQAIRARVPLVQVPPRGVWGASGLAAHTTLDSWLAGQTELTIALDDLVLRYLGAFGPATVKDIQAWSGLTRLREVTDRLGDRLVRLHHTDGHELLDLPDAPRPNPGAPAPVRFLYDYDNLLLSHADRSRFGGQADVEGLYSEHGPVPGPVLVDGLLRAGWRLTRSRADATLVVRTSRPMPAATEDAVVQEGRALLDFLAPDASTRDVSVRPVE